ncbi:DNA-directed RNA polymerase i subunit rpa34 [Anaeramoeba flamelloides]|uniref:DNA-directed RNA polymerase i subunit rpa34 n=1 Tax=Anaeramoeba flamelloides TaxID=1746091 RepID=A0AAV7YRU7_9EUKA|nr:DNA-directed RNA polymerase i subunit rpa34 [Anaeramoeba flamelloides]
MDQITNTLRLRTQQVTNYVTDKKKLIKMKKNKKNDQNTLTDLINKISKQEKNIRQMDQNFVNSLNHLFETTNNNELLTIKTFLTTFHKVILGLSLNKKQTKFDSYINYQNNKDDPKIEDINPFTELIHKKQPNQDLILKEKTRKKKKKKKKKDNEVNDDLTQNLFAQPQPLIQKEKKKKKSNKNNVTSSRHSPLSKSQNNSTIKHFSHKLSSSTGNIQKNEKQIKNTKESKNKNKKKSDMDDNGTTANKSNNYNYSQASTLQTNSKMGKKKGNKKNNKKKKNKEREDIINFKDNPKNKSGVNFNEIFNVTINEPYLIIESQQIKPIGGDNKLYSDDQRIWEVTDFSENRDQKKMNWNDSMKMRNQFEESTQSDSEQEISGQYSLEI